MTIDQVQKQLARLSAALVLISDVPLSVVAAKLPEIREHLDEVQCEVDRLREMEFQAGEGL